MDTATRPNWRRLVAAVGDRGYGNGTPRAIRLGDTAGATRLGTTRKQATVRHHGPASACTRAFTATLLTGVLLTGASCSMFDANFLGGTGTVVGTQGFVGGFLGGVVADEPRAALAARDVLSAGGNAADAAVAVAFTLAVTLPSRAGLGGGGACVAYAPNPDGPGHGAPEAVLFLPAAPAQPAGDRPAAVPTMTRGMFALHARYGRLSFEQIVAPAEKLARFGVPASRALVRDIGVVAGPLAGDPASRAIFFANGQPLTEGALLQQPDLGASLAQLRTAGVGDLYQGTLARSFVAASALAGGPVSDADLRQTLPRVLPTLDMDAGNDIVSLLPPPADGGVATAAALRVLLATPDAFDQARTQGLAAAAAARRLPGGMQALPASTTFATLDRSGDAVVCALTMNNLFGTGRIAPGTGIVLAASPAALPPPLLAAAIVWNRPIQAFRAAVGASGQDGAPLAAAVAVTQAEAQRGATATPLSIPVPEPGRANVIQCNRYLPGNEGTCAWATDSRGAGLAVGSSGKK